MDKKTVVTRYAPSPTGMMHIGNLRTALYAYLTAKSQGGKFIVRIEDTDQKRLVDGAVEVILDTLKLAGIKYDEGPIIGGEHGPYVQTERLEIYKEWAQKLVDSGKAYYCFCEKKEAVETEENVIVAEPCRDADADFVKKNLDAGKIPVLRHKAQKQGQTSYFDHVFGEITVENDTLYDIILMKSNGIPTYNFAHVVDDYLMGVTHVVRGNEYITSTPQYVQIHEDLGLPLPEYYHLPLIMGKDEEGNVSKLSKRHGAVSFADLVAEGYLPSAIVNYIALLGWHPANTDQEIFSIEELIKIFNPDDIRKSASIFDYDKLKWFNAQYIAKMSIAEFKEYAKPFMENTLTREVFDLDKLCEILMPRIQTFGEIGEKVEFFQELVDFDINLLFNDKKKTNQENAKEILEATIKAMDSVALGDWQNDILYSKLEEVSAQTGYKPVSIMWVVRLALSGQTVTVGGATEIMQILGKSETMIRLQTTLNRL